MHDHRNLLRHVYRMIGINMWLRIVYITSRMHHVHVCPAFVYTSSFHRWSNAPMRAQHAEHPSPYVHVNKAECITYVV